jgi:hypothetical protein
MESTSDQRRGDNAGRRHYNVIRLRLLRASIAPWQAQGGEGAEAEDRQGLPYYLLNRFTAVKDLFEGWRWLQLGVA